MGLCFQACGNIGFKHTAANLFFMCLFFFSVLSFCFFSFYLLELKDKKNKMGQ